MVVFRYVAVFSSKGLTADAPWFALEDEIADGFRAVGKCEMNFCINRAISGIVMLGSNALFMGETQFWSISQFWKKKSVILQQINVEHYIAVHNLIGI